MRTMARHAARGAAGTASRVPSGFGGGPYSLCVQPSAPRPRTHVHGRATLPSDASMRSRCGQPGGRSARRGAAVWAEDRVRTLAGGGGRAAGTAITPRGPGAAVWGRANAAIRLTSGAPARELLALSPWRGRFLACPVGTPPQRRVGSSGRHYDAVACRSRRESVPTSCWRVPVRVCRRTARSAAGQLRA